ncbi:exodeoxyribonuclease V subunit gamma [Arachidicoccus terrestris]|uniref:exodeoxyribonuclease V subunit gamma n=1 Tax=Arachidicoccus terrestris TaxID=2875539 RepID=UPI001CC81AD9|nr:exodeoxyribonuclease V subunit gamma [Arachidicoccus terrestris]UAY55931.1 exodeoxyribonuclease V subunit gamma [Arachidicoccus terrestris]
MAFHLKVSNSLEELSGGLCRDMAEHKGDVFRPQYVITQTDGMNNWLSLQLAERQGIAAGIQYLKPNDLIFRIYFLLGGAAEATMSADNLCWLLFNLMGAIEFEQQFPSIARYYQLENPETASETELDIARVKRLGLAKKVADLFDQYQIYRSDMIKEWNKGRMHGKDLEEWQFYLWEKARQRAGEIGSNAFVDKNQIADYIENTLRDPVSESYLQSKMPAVFIFGISLLTEFHLHIFDLLSDKIQIYFYLLNPAPSDYWFDDLSEKRLVFLRKLGQVDPAEQPQGHPLLQSLGKVIKDTFSMLFKKDDILNAYESLPEIFPEQDSLLHKLQLSIYENRTPENGITVFDEQDIKDGSLTVHSCYSPLREVESLYDFLVYLIDQKREQLSPRDIVVMISDIDYYAAYIRAIFDHAPYKFPYRIADERFTEADSITSALESILLLEPAAFTAETVLRLLDSSFIRTHRRLSRIDLLRRVLDGAGIRFGINGSYTDDSVYVSWRYGLRRIMFGICMAGEDEVGTGPEGFYPLDLVEGNDSEEVIRFVAFAEDLIEMLEDRKNARTLADWSSFIKDVLERFVLTEQQQGDEEFEYLATLLADYNSAEAFLDEKLSFSVFMESFGERLVQSSRNGNFAAGGITFCSLIPMRSIPFKVVALLGLDYDKFPRKEQSLGFNLMELQKRPGDRNVKANDKHLFLETILSARDYLYISYIGRSVKDNSAIPASGLVDELIDYIAGQSSDPEGVREKMVIKHALHHFSPEKESKVPQYLHLIPSTGLVTEIKDKPAEEELGETELPLKDFIRFLQQPIKGYLNRVAGIYYEDSDDVLKDEEVFELSALQRYQYRDTLIELTGEDAWERFRDKGVKTGLLPLKNSARLEMIQLQEEVGPVKELLDKEIEGLTKVDIPVCYKVEDLTVNGKVTLYGKKLIAVSWSKNEFKAVLEGYIEYLMLAASGIATDFAVISFKNGQVFHGVPLDADQATSALDRLVKVYKEGQQKILPFVLGLDLGNKGPDYRKWHLKIRDKTSGGMFVDAYIDKADEMGIFNPVAFEQYSELAAVLEKPLMEMFPDFPMLS